MIGKRERFQNLLEELFTEMKNEFEEMRDQGLDRKDISGDGDVVTKVDQKMTEIVVSFFEKQEKEYRLESEEMKKEGSTQGSDNPDYTVIFDEIDGTGNMRDYAGPYGPIVAIAEGSEPAFNDVIASGFYEMTRNIFYHAYRGIGAFKRHGMSGEDQVIESSSGETLEIDTGLLIDQAMLSKKPGIAVNAWQSWCNDFGSQGHHYALIAEGVREGFMTGGHGLMKDKNTAEELAGMYLIAKEADASIVDWKAESIENNKIGMGEELNHNIIVASTDKLAENISQKIL